MFEDAHGNRITLREAREREIAYWQKEVYDAYLAALRKANRDAESASLAGAPLAMDARAALAIALTRFARDVRQVARHPHRWDEDTLCAVCGADGRA